MKQLLLIQWVDTHMDVEGWKLLSEVERDREGILVNTVGFVVDIADDAVTVAPNYAEDPEQVSMMMTIPKSSVVSIYEVPLKLDY